MNPDQENFETLRKLLALKKYEQPPPRYFSELPTRIWTRIEREPVSIPFWERFLPNFGLNPALAYSFGLLACGTLVFGIGYSLRTEPTQTAIRPISDDNLQVSSSGVATVETTGLSPGNFQPAQLASTNPVMNAEPLRSLFGNPQIQLAPVGFSPGQ